LRRNERDRSVAPLNWRFARSIVWIGIQFYRFERYLPPAWNRWPIVRPPVDRVGSRSRTAHHQALKKLLLWEFSGLAYID
jgi:hypothetical protein